MMIDDSVLPVLKAFAANMDAPSVVRESCIVALDMWEVRLSSTLLVLLYTSSSLAFSFSLVV
jgi:hypothetical protein